MTRISSLLVASTLAMLPIGAFAQPAAAPAKTAAPTSMTTSTQTTATAPVGSKSTSAAATAAKPDVKTQPGETKTQVHGSGSATTPAAKPIVPSKS
jgi:hypothetical protein